jgi:predicted MFS family arabinose efflux permease
VVALPVYLSAEFGWDHWSVGGFLIVSYAGEDGISLDVGFYYMANAAGRLLGTVLSGWLFQQYGLTLCLWCSAGFIALAALISPGLPKPVSAEAVGG